jgi:hypothetical protein
MELALPEPHAYIRARTYPSPLFRGLRFFSRFPGVPLRFTPGYTPLHLRRFPKD